MSWEFSLLSEERLPFIEFLSTIAVEPIQGVSMATQRAYYENWQQYTVKLGLVDYNVPSLVTQYAGGTEISL